MRNGGALAIVIVTREHQRGAILAGSRQIRMSQDVARSIDSGSFSVPDPEYAVDLGFPDHAKNLAAHHRGRREVLIYARIVMDLVLVQYFLGSRQQQIVSAEGRTFVTGNKSRRFET